MLPYLKTGGHVVVSTRAVKPVTATLSGFDYDAPRCSITRKANVPNLTFVNADQACSDIGSQGTEYGTFRDRHPYGVLDFTISEIESIMEADTSGEVPRDESPGTELQYITIRSIINQPAPALSIYRDTPKKGEGHTYANY